MVSELPLLNIIKRAQSLGFTLMITTDHGTINVRQPSKILGDRESSTNIRYKTGKRLNTEDKNLYTVSNPKILVYQKSTCLAVSLCYRRSVFDYPSNYNHFVNFYKNTYQHGGILWKKC